MPDLPASTPEWERTPGKYQFDPSGEMNYESRDGKFLRKENGAWTEWRFFDK